MTGQCISPNGSWCMTNDPPARIETQSTVDKAAQADIVFAKIAPPRENSR